ncbi:HAUS augmin-like complex subunit 5 [Oenanthe melanoleuca]|uniref:HAUS augmin-like complex subunit 5 n=1 Tax=Oenanthe melanoleuca TaxID=2939378 RepID=UPI0024C1EA8B|nr:HAUS augmin-like complex subunit 5 [Oenanthe melanoleuca]
MMAEALGLWIREELELPPSAVPSPAVLRRLCSGHTAPLWDFVTRHVRSDRNVKKIRGNLRWYGHLQEMEGAAGPPSRQGALRAELVRRRKELQALEDAIDGAQEAARRLETSLRAGQSRRWAGLQRGAELRLLAAELSSDWLRVGHQGALTEPLKRAGQSCAELSAMLASGAEPEVLVSIKALCRAKEELQRPRPPRDAQQEAQDWLDQAQAALVSHSPGAVLWALQELANQSARALLSGPAPSPQAPPTLRSRLQESWGAVGGVWAQLPPLLSHLSRLRRRLQQLQPHLGSQESTWAAARLSLTRAGLEGFWGSLSRDLQQLRGDPQKPQKTPKSPRSDPKTPKSPELAPKAALGRLQRQLRRRRGRVLRLQQRLQFLNAATRGRRAALRPLQEQVVGVARAGPGSAPPQLEGEGRRRCGLVLGALGALGEPLPHPGAPPPLPELGGQQGVLLARAAALKQQLRQGALRARRAGLGAGPEAPPLPPAAAPLPPPALAAQLRALSGGCRDRIGGWGRLRALVAHWWTQPAQFALATPPGRAPFSHWLRRWREAARGLSAPPTSGMAAPTSGMAAPTSGMDTPTSGTAAVAADPEVEGEGQQE